MKVALRFAIISGGAFALILFFGAGVIEHTIYPEYSGVQIPLRVLAPTIFIVALLGVFRGFFQGKRTMIPTAVSQIIEQVVNAIVSVAASYLFMKWNADSLRRLHGERRWYPWYMSWCGIGSFACYVCILVIPSGSGKVRKRKM